jgi:aconitate hydratase
MAPSRTLTQKLIDDHLSGEADATAEEINLVVDQILIEDVTGPMTALQFEVLGVERVQVPLAVLYVDHNVIQIDDRNMDDHRYLQSFCARYGVLYSRPGNGISHYVHLERFARPGELLVGADSHTPLAGSVGMLAIPAGGLEVAVAMAGRGFSLERPRTVGVELRGSLQPWVQSKDIILELLRRYGVRGGRGRIFEFFGEALAGLSVTDRATICNMIVETGATTAMFPSDEVVRAWLVAQQREAEYRPLTADAGAVYDEVVVIELSTLEPLIAKPHSPGNVVPVREVAGTEVVQVCVGSSVNSSFEDLALVAAVLRGQTVDPRVEMTVTPGSRQILDAIARAGVYQDLVAAGARLLEPVCGPCVGLGQAPSAGQPSVRTFNRNFPGRSGTVGDQVYLCSPATATATALAGEIKDPRDLGIPPSIPTAEWNPSIDDRNIVSPPPAEAARHVRLVKGPNIVPPPEPQPVPERIEGRVTIVVQDDVSTGDMAPDGVLGMAVWSNIPECATYMFRWQDPDFYERALAWGGGFIVGAHNYGQGSSREQAALSALLLGIRAVVAKSFARIHRRNLIAQGILPLVFANEDDYHRLKVGDTLVIRGVRSTLRRGRKTLSAEVEGGGAIALEIQTQPREREVLLAGGMLKYLGHPRRYSKLGDDPSGRPRGARPRVGAVRPTRGPAR